MKSWEIVGYTFNADIYCPDCIVNQVTMHHHGQETGVSLTTEHDLDILAQGFEINRMDEETFDSGDFPKVIFVDQEQGEHCGNCHNALIEHDCPADCYGNE